MIYPSIVIIIVTATLRNFGAVMHDAILNAETTRVSSGVR